MGQHRPKQSIRILTDTTSNPAANTLWEINTSIAKNNNFQVEIFYSRLVNFYFTVETF
jgi:hypothetical protein